jgi:hypothetical protein
MEFRTRPKWHVINDLIDRLETLPANDPERQRLIRTIRSLQGDLDASPQGDLFAGATRLDDNGSMRSAKSTVR